MCSYDNMIVAPTTQFTALVVRTNKNNNSQSRLPHNILSNLNRNFTKLFERASVVLIFILLISPLSGETFILPEKTDPLTPNLSSLRHSHPRVGVGEEFLANRPRFVLPFSSNIYSSHSTLKSPRLTKVVPSLQKPEGSTRHQHHFLLQDILAGSRVPPSDLLVPNSPSGVSLGKVFIPSSSQSRVSSWRPPQGRGHLRPPLLDMSEEDSAGRERRATSSTPSAGRGEWENPCANLDLSPDKNSTPQNLSELILRVLNQAKSQVDQFIDNFARNNLHAESWKASLPKYEAYYYDFLNNTSSIDLSKPENVPFHVALQEAFELMQRRAVGIEQVTLDQAVYPLKFLTDFQNLELKIKHVLCELRYAMGQSRLDPKLAIDRNIMDEVYRKTEGERERNIRDAVILREYVRGLELLHSLFSYYASNP